VADTPQPGDAGDPDDRRFPPFSLDMTQLMRMLQSEGPVNWDIARQVAAWVALEGRDEKTVHEDDREQLQDLARAAQTHVVGATGLTATFQAPVRALEPRAWADLHLEALRPVLEALATSLDQAVQRDLEDLDPAEAAELFGGGELGADPLRAMLPALAPTLLGLQAGSMVGYLAQHALGRYDLPLPTGDAPSLTFVVPNIDRFEAQWSLPRADLRFYVALHEVVHAAQRSVPWVQARLVGLAREYVAGYQIDPDAFEARFGTIDPSDPASLQGIAQDPGALLGAMRTAEQELALGHLQVLTSVLEGHADFVLARVGQPLIPTFDRIHEAIERHRLERGEAGRFIEGLLGLQLDREHYELGGAFCSGVVERVGTAGLERLWEGEDRLPTRPELEAPGLWLARIDLPDA